MYFHWNRKQNIRKQNGTKFNLLNAGKESNKEKRKKEMILKRARKRNETIREKYVWFEDFSLIQVIIKLFKKQTSDKEDVSVSVWKDELNCP